MKNTKINISYNARSEKIQIEEKVHRWLKIQNRFEFGQNIWHRRIRNLKNNFYRPLLYRSPDVDRIIIIIIIITSRNTVIVGRLFKLL